MQGKDSGERCAPEFFKTRLTVEICAPGRFLVRLFNSEHPIALLLCTMRIRRRERSTLTAMQVWAGRYPSSRRFPYLGHGNPASICIYFLEHDL